MSISRKSQALNKTLISISLSSLIGIFSKILPASSQQINEPICYMQTTNGQIVDLARLCNRTPENSEMQTPPATQSVHPLRRGRNAGQRFLRSHPDQPTSGTLSILSK
jgi:hypothetical protein